MVGGVVDGITGLRGGTGATGGIAGFIVERAAGTVGAGLGAGVMDTAAGAMGARDTTGIGGGGCCICS